MLRRIFTIHVDFPALDALVLFLRESEQSQIDAAVNSLSNIRARLSATRARLGVAVEQQEK